MNNNSRGIALEGEYDLADREALATLFGSLRAGSPVTIDLTKVLTSIQRYSPSY